MDLTRTLAFSIEDAGRLEAVAALLEKCAPQEILKWAFNQFAGGVAIATGLGAEGVAMIDMAVKIDARPDIFFIDTGFLFPETYALRRQIEDRYGIEIRALRPGLTPESQESEYGPRLWSRDPDLCCRIRKLEPLKDALKGLTAWMTAIRRDQTPERARARVVEWDYIWQLVKINPMAAWTRREVWDYIAKNRVPYNPLRDEGYTSIGCTHCTRRTVEGEPERAGRWSAHHKTECGLHALPQAGAASNSFEV
jgi:phosphoadenosine phosphosulfate reductase